MNTKSKNVSQIIILMILTTLLLSACVDNSITLQTAPEIVNECAEQIASFDLPVGFQPEINAEMLGYTLVSYKGSSDMSHLYLVYSENEADEEKLTNILEKLSPGSYDRKDQAIILETKTMSVRGEDASLVINEAINGDGKSYRQAILVFQGKKGPTLLVYSEPAENWDQQIVEDLISSIK